MDPTGKFRIWQKFASIAVLCAAVAALPLYGYVGALRAELQAARAESSAIEPERQLLRLMRAVQAHRLHAAAVLGGDSRALAACDADAADAIASLDAVSRAFSAPAPDGDDIVSAFRRWLAELHSGLASHSIDAAQSAQRHERLVQDVQSWIDATARSRGLDRDSGVASGPLLAAALDGLPRLLEAFSQLQLLARSGPAPRNADSAPARAVLLERIRAASAETDRDFDRALQGDPDLRLSLGVRARLAADAARHAIAAAPQAPAALDAAVLAQAELADAALTAAAATLAARHTDRLRTLMTVLLFAGLGGAISAWLLWTTALSTTRSMAQASALARRFGRAAWAPEPASADAAGLDLDRSTVTDLVDAIRRRSAETVGEGGHDAGRSADAPRA